MSKPKQGHIWRRWNTTLTAENASNRPPRLTGEVPNCGARDQIPYGSLDDDGTTLLQSDERAAEGMDH